MTVCLNDRPVEAEKHASFFVDNVQLESEAELFIDGPVVAKHEAYLRLYDKPVRFGAYAMTFAKVLAWSVEYMRSCYPDFTATGFEFLNSETLLLVGKTQHGDVAGLVSFAVLRTEPESRTVVVIAEPLVGAFVQLEPRVIAIVSDTVTVRLLAKSVLQPKILKNKFLKGHDPVLMVFNELITLADVNPKLVTQKPELNYAKLELLPPAQDSLFYVQDTVFNDPKEFQPKLIRLRQEGVYKIRNYSPLCGVAIRYPATEILPKLELIEKYEITHDFETHKAKYKADCEIYSYADLALITISDSLYVYDKPHLVVLEAGVSSFGHSPLYLNTQDKIAIIASAQDYAKQHAKVKDWLTRQCLRQMLDERTHWIGLLHKHRGMDEDYLEFERMEMMLSVANQIA